MKRLHITRSAFKDLTAIWLYIAVDSIDAADQVRDDLEKDMHKLCEMPGMGHTRADVTLHGYRFWRVHSYMIAYRVKGGTLFCIEGFAWVSQPSSRIQEARAAMTRMGAITDG